MLRTKINDNWQLAKGGTSMMSALQGGLEFETINLPHDAMVHEERTPDTENGTQTGYWPGRLIHIQRSCMHRRSGETRRRSWNLRAYT